MEGWRYQKQGGMEWKEVVLPHDAMIHERREPEGEGGSAHGYFPGGVYTYEKKFEAPAEWKDKTVFLEFEGVYRNSKVYINGQEAGGHPYGYVPFTVCADAFLQYGAQNTITVTADNSKLPNSRWYSGSGIYRPVHLIVGNKTHIAWQGVRISTLSYSPARIRIETDVNGGEVAVEVRELGILAGLNVKKGSGAVVANGRGTAVELDIPDAKLWSDESPFLYECHVTLSENGIVADEVIERFGIRLVEWSSKGLFINGKETLLRGGCYHHDNGILGAATWAKSEERRVRIMKENGFNALRSSHNPTSDALVEACDKYGVYLMDETFDMWYMHKSKYDYATDFEQWWKQDTKAMVDRDFNHPSVILYSIGNEVSEPYEQKGVAQTKAFVDYIHSLDKNRAVTGGINLMIIVNASKGKGIYKDAEEGGGPGPQAKKQKKEKASGSLAFNIVASVVGTGMNKAANSDKADQVTSPCLDALDIAGYNYASGRYPLEGQKHPARLIFGSETFPQDIYKNWEMVKKYPYLIGDFMWTSWDYLGEAGIGAWSYSGGMPFNRPYPWVLGGAGVIDILGNPDVSCKYAAMVWGLLNKPVIGVRPVNHPGVRVSKSVWRGTNAIESWAWKNCDDNKAEVEVYAKGAYVKLYVNGKSVGKKKLKENKAMFKTKYVPGILTAVAYDAAGKELSKSELRSATGKVRISAKPEEQKIAVGDIAYIPIALVGENGVVEHNADMKLSVEVEGGELLAFGSANPCTEEQYDSGSFTTYYGKALAVVYAKAKGKIVVNVKGDEGLTATASVDVQ